MGQLLVTLPGSSGPSANGVYCSRPGEEEGRGFTVLELIATAAVCCAGCGWGGGAPAVFPERDGSQLPTERAEAPACC